MIVGNINFVLLPAGLISLFDFKILHCRFAGSRKRSITLILSIILSDLIRLRISKKKVWGEIF